MSNPSPSSSSTQSNSSLYSFSFLSRLIPQTFSGAREELTDFLANCNSTFELADATQHQALLYVILSKISGSAKAQLMSHTFNSWDDLKTRLKTLYQDKKHYVQLLEELNQQCQNREENVTEFYQRIDQTTTKILTALHQENLNEKPEVLTIKSQVINENAKNR